MLRLQPCVNQNSVSVNHGQGDGHLPCDALQCICVLVLKCTRTLIHGCVRKELLIFALECRSSCETVILVLHLVHVVLFLYAFSKLRLVHVVYVMHAGVSLGL